VRQMRAQLQAKCESAPLRRSVTEPATAINAYSSRFVKKVITLKKLRLFAVVIG
jgi:hypothetical protein